LHGQEGIGAKVDRAGCFDARGGAVIQQISQIDTIDVRIDRDGVRLVDGVKLVVGRELGLGRIGRWVLHVQGAISGIYMLCAYWPLTRRLYDYGIDVTLHEDVFDPQRDGQGVDDLPREVGKDLLLPDGISRWE
jgi:hypothetical protein